MELTTAWVNYVNRLSAIDKAATNRLGEMVGKIPNFSFENPEHMALLVNEAYAVSNVYGEAAATLAAEMYDAIGLASGMFLDPAELAVLHVNILDAIMRLPCLQEQLPFILL